MLADGARKHRPTKQQKSVDESQAVEKQRRKNIVLASEKVVVSSLEDDAGESSAALSLEEETLQQVEGESGGVDNGMPSYPVYHVGPVMSNPFNIYVVWYGKWASKDQDLIRDFLGSLDGSTSSQLQARKLRGAGLPVPVPSVASWWALTKQYEDREGAGVSSQVSLAGEVEDRAMSLGPSLTRNSTKYVVRGALSSFGGSLPVDPSGLYLVLTSPEVRQEDFCSTACGFHSFTYPSFTSTPAQVTPGSVESLQLTGGLQLPYAWVGNPSEQCPGFCGFPFKAPAFIPEQYATTLRSPNGDAGLDAMIATLAHELAETATDPFLNAWFTGDSRYPLEIADACLGTFGPNAYPGNPGKALLSADTEGGHYNVEGRNGKKFLLPFLWDNKRGACAGQA
eukprot:jgi/Mesen1/9835/ME000070S09122